MIELDERRGTRLLNTFQKEVWHVPHPDTGTHGSGNIPFAKGDCPDASDHMNYDAARTGANGYTKNLSFIDFFMNAYGSELFDKHLKNTWCR